MRRLGCVLVVVLAVLAVTLPAVAEGGYAPPVGGPVVDHFRSPLTRFGAGNRGIDYATVPGQPVRAAAPGEVVFAGRVGLSRHVVVLHADGLRTSYSFLEEVDVRRGDHVDAGATVGRAGHSLHFGVRDGQDRYLDPEVLLRGDPLGVHLVPLRSQSPASEAAERRGLVASLVGLASGGVHVAATGVAWAADTAAEVAVASLDQLQALLVSTLVDTYGLPVVTAVELVRGIELFRDGQRDCTPGGSPPRPPTGGRHLAVLVAGFGSSSGQSAVLDIDTAALGYAPGDVAQFSYAGGQAPGRRTIDGVEEHAYGPPESEGDIGEAGGRLHALLVDLGREHPGVPIDLIAHSQGGLVVRVALAVDEDLPRIDHVVTLGTPHHGADLADINAAVGRAPAGVLAQAEIRQATGGGIDPWSSAIDQLRTDSSFSDDLARVPLPDGIRFTSIAASGDYIVPAPRAALDGATNVVVPVVGMHPHDALPGSEAAAREVALALADQHPTCVSIRGALLGAVVAMAEHEVAHAATAASGWQAGVPVP